MKKKKPEVFYRPIDGSAPLSIYWYEGPKGDAVEANNEDGVGFFGPSGELLGVIFDDVSEKKDSQTLLFDHYRVNIEVNKGKVSYSVHEVENRKTGT
jgi:hypothetical protein